MLTGVAFCPQAPALVPDLGRGLDAELGPVREACRAAIRRVAQDGAALVVVGGAEAAGEYGPTSRGSFAGWGLDLTVPLGSEQPGPVELPAALTVGAWLVRDALGPDTATSGIALTAGWHGLETLPLLAPTALVVMGEGSARRTAKAPGYLDERAAAYDHGLATALASGVGERLGAVLRDTRDPRPDADLEDDLLVAGHWVRDQVAAEVEGGPGWEAEVLYDDAPFGVGYFVAAWLAGEVPEPPKRRWRLGFGRGRGPGRTGG